MEDTLQAQRLPFIFFGTIRKVRIISNNICFGTLPLEGKEFEQHLTINREGRVWLSRYAFSEDLSFTKRKKTEQKQFRIDKEKAGFLLDKFTDYFRGNLDFMYATDVGGYEMMVEDDCGDQARFVGPLVCEYVVDGYDLSQLVRDTLEDDSLFVFDGAPSESDD